MGAERAAVGALIAERIARQSTTGAIHQIPLRRPSPRGERIPMSLVTATILIDASPADVWALVMDAESLGEWVTIHRKLLHAEEGPPRVGYKMDQRIQIRGVSLDVHWTLVECRPRALAVWEGRGPARSRALSEYVLTEQDGATKFDYRNDFRPPLGPVGALVSRALVGGIPEREAARTLARLRALLEPVGSQN
jgi:Polyketide cyclase / dehydrase and lipid transport